MPYGLTAAGAGRFRRKPLWDKDLRRKPRANSVPQNILRFGLAIADKYVIIGVSKGTIKGK